MKGSIEKRTMKAGSAALRNRLMTVVILSLSFLASRIVFWLLGVRFDTSSLAWFWQYLDPKVLTERLLPGLFYLHGQPPGFNLFIGSCLKCFPATHALWFHGVYLVLGFLLYSSIYLFLRMAQFSRPVAWLCAFCFIISPSSILYENWLFYTYPVATLLALAAVALRQFERGRSAYAAGLFLSLIMLVCLTRSAFHLLFLILCTCFVLIPRTLHRRRILLYAGVAVAVVAALYLKNFCVFGFFGSTSWTGMNLAKITRPAIGTNRIERLVEAGRLAEIALIEPFRYIDDYPIAVRMQAPVVPDTPELAAKRKTNGHWNLNHREYIPVSKAYEHVSKFIMRVYWRDYLSQVGESLLVFCAPSWHYCLVASNRRAISDYVDFLSGFRLRGWVSLPSCRKIFTGSDGPPNRMPLASLLLPPGVLIFLAFTVVELMVAIRRKQVLPVTYAFVSFSILYVTVIGSAFESGENNRFRIMIDPLIFLMSLVVCGRVFRSIQCLVRRRIR